MMDGWCGICEIWLVVIVVGGSFVIIQYLMFNFIGLELLDIILVLVSLVFLILFFKVWQLQGVSEVFVVSGGVVVVGGGYGG